MNRVLIAAAVYVIGGVAYQRTVMHQRGWRQLPNYSIWAGIASFIKVSIFKCLDFLWLGQRMRKIPLDLEHIA